MHVLPRTAVRRSLHGPAHRLRHGRGGRGGHGGQAEGGQGLRHQEDGRGRLVRGGELPHRRGRRHHGGQRHRDGQGAQRPRHEGALLRDRLQCGGVFFFAAPLFFFAIRYMRNLIITIEILSLFVPHRYL